MLSRQFDHTFWHEGDNLKAMWKGSSGINRPTRLQPEDASPESLTQRLDEMVEPRRQRGLQGSLFSPYVGTGLKDDPTVPEKSRRAWAQMSLGTMDNVDGPAITEVLHNTDMPTHVMRDMAMRGDVGSTFVGSDIAYNHGYFRPGSKAVRISRGMDEDTLVHEMGHASTPDIGSPWNHIQSMGRRYDPAHEGLADGRADRYAPGSHDPRASDLAESRQQSRERDAGYTTKAFGDDLEQALYASTRRVSMFSDRGVRSLPSRESLLADRVAPHDAQYAQVSGKLWGTHPDIPYDEATPQSDRRMQRSMDKLLMGHIVEHRPDATTHLNEDQMSAAMEAHAYYKKTEPRSFFERPGEEYHQEKLF